MLHRELGAAKAWNSLWSSNPTFPALPNVTTHTGQAPHQLLCPPGGKGAHKHHFGLVLPLWVTFKSDFLSSLTVWMTRYSESLEGEEVIKRNSANLFYFLSLLDNLFICSPLTRCRQTYFPMDRVNPSPKVPHVYLDFLSQSASNSYYKVPLIFWGKQSHLQHTQM